MNTLARACKLALLCTLLCAGLLLCAGESFAQQAPAPPPVASKFTNIIAPGGKVCYLAKGEFIEKVVNCLVDAGGLVPAVISTFIQEVKPYAMGLNTVIILLVITLFSLKLIFTADIQNTARDSWILLFKIGGVAYFTANADTIYMDVVGMMTGFLEIISKGTTIATGVCTQKTASGPWAIWDCMLMKLFGVGIASSLLGSATGIATAGILGFLGLNLLANPVAWIIFCIGLYFVLKLIFVMARILHIYLIACIGLGFIFCIAFLFMPAIFFSEVKTYFDKWLRMVIGYVLTPLMLFAYMGFALSAVDSVVVSGPYSLIRMIAGGTVANSVPVDQNGKAIPNAPNSVGGKLVSGNMALKQPIISGLSMNTSPNEAPNVKNPKNIDSGATGTMRSGTEGGKSAGSVVISSNAAALDYNKAAAGTGKSAGKYLYDVFISMVVSTLLVYILYSLLSYIPDLATDITMSGFQQGSIAKERAIGEVMVQQTIGAVKDIAVIAVAVYSGGSVGQKEAIKAGMQLANRAEKVMRNDPKELRG